MPLTIRTLADLVSGLQGLIPEKSRTIVYQRISNLIANALQENSDALRNWLEIGRLRFARECNLTEAWVPDDLKVEQTELTKFCNKWLSVTAFKLKNESDAEWRPINPEQNALRVTMIQELRELAKHVSTS